MVIKDERVDYLYKKYLGEGSQVYDYLLQHSLKVFEKALSIMKMNAEKSFDEEKVYLGAMLHDIGVIYVNAPDIACFGDLPYLAHGYMGRKILEDEGLHEIAPVCERHVGVGFTAAEIKLQKLPLPQRDMLPLSAEEKLICVADKFYSKSSKYLLEEKPLHIVQRSILKHGDDKLKALNELLMFFKLLDNPAM